MRSRIKKLLPKFCLKILKEIRYIWIVTLFHIFQVLPICKNRVVICNVWGFGDNAKYVTEELAQRLNKDTSIDLIFITNHPKTAYAPKEVRVLKTNSIGAILALATAKVWVDNNRKENYIRKRKAQYYIQTWHGGIALKKIEKDYAEKLGSKYIANAKRDSDMADLFISNSKFCTDMYRNSFWYQKEILECGSPRNDILIHSNEELQKKIKHRLGIAYGKRIAIYAPTYREDGNTKNYKIDYENLRSVLEDTLGGEWIIAVKLHPLVSDQSSYLEYNQNIINVTYYRDLYELMAVGDLLITDYSNVMFEFSLMKKPVFLYAPDVEEYEKNRGFYFKYETLPYTKAKTEKSLFHNIKTYEHNLYQEKTEKFLESLDLYEYGNASKQVVDRILEVLNKD